MRALQLAVPFSQSPSGPSEPWGEEGTVGGIGRRTEGGGEDPPQEGARLFSGGPGSLPSLRKVMCELASVQCAKGSPSGPLLPSTFLEKGRKV